MGTVAAIAVPAISINEQRKTQKKTEKANANIAKIDRAQQGEEAARSRRTSIREAQIRRAQIANVAGAAGQVDSSAIVAGTQQIDSSLNENIGNINTSLAFANARSVAQQSLIKAKRTSNLQILADTAIQSAGPFKS